MYDVAVWVIASSQDDVWDGINEDDRPLSNTEWEAGLQAVLKKA